MNPCASRSASRGRALLTRNLLEGTSRLALALALLPSLDAVAAAASPPVLPQNGTFKAGTPGAVHELPTPLDGWEQIDGGRIAQQVGDRVSVFDAAAGRHADDELDRPLGIVGRRVLVPLPHGRCRKQKAREQGRIFQHRVKFRS